MTKAIDAVKQANDITGGTASDIAKTCTPGNFYLTRCKVHADHLASTGKDDFILAGIQVDGTTTWTDSFDNKWYVYGSKPQPSIVTNHISSIPNKTAVNLSTSGLMWADPYHNAIERAAHSLVALGKGQAVYGGQWGSGVTWWQIGQSTVRVDAEGSVQK